MCGGHWLLGLVLLAVGWSGRVVGAEPDPEAVRRLMEKYEREAAEEAAKKAPAPKPALKRSTPPPRPTKTLLADRYRDHGDGTVTDVKTGLQWMRCSLGQTWRSETCIGEVDRYTWQAALDAADALNRRGGQAGYRDWRMPTKAELQTLIYCSSGRPQTWNDTGNSCEGDYQRPTLYQPAFPNTPALWYWSSSVYAGHPDDAWNVYFDDGNVYAGFKAADGHARLVRGGQ